MFGDNLFWQGDTGFVIGGKAVQADVESAQDAADLGLGEDRLTFQRLERIRDGLCVVALDRHADGQPDEREEHDEQRRALGRGELLHT